MQRNQVQECKTIRNPKTFRVFFIYSEEEILIQNNFGHPSNLNKYFQPLFFPFATLFVEK